MLRLEKILFYLLIFCLPWQTRKIIYQFGGNFNEWTSIYLYLTDLLLLAILFLWLWRQRKKRFFQAGFKISSGGLVIFLTLALISLVKAENLQLGFYSWFKLLELAAFFFYLKHNFKELFNFSRLSQIILASGLLQSLIAVGQYGWQKSLGLSFLRESPLGPEIVGVAKINLTGTTFIRAYGTLPHPNLLAVFLFLAIFCLYYLWLKDKINYVCLIVFYGLLFFALTLTFSRVIMAVFLTASLTCFLIYFRKFKRKIFYLFLLLLVLGLSFVFLAWPETSSRWAVSLDEQSVTLRALYNQAAFFFIQEEPFLGVGLGNFVWRLRQMLDLLTNWIHQPIHNLYLLIAAEIGLVGLAAFLFFIFRLFKKNYPNCLLIILSAFLLMGVFDHFFWTLQQGQLMLWLILGIIGAGDCPHSSRDRAPRNTAGR